MSKPSVSLIKTCTVCGLQKPLSAFLQLTGPDGTTYGNICATCRKTFQEPIPKEPEEGARRGTGGAKIRANERVASEIGKKEHKQQIEERYQEEEEKEDKIKATQTQKIEKISKDQQLHREGFLRRSFLDTRSKTEAPDQAGSFSELTAKEQRIDLTTGPFRDTEIAGKIKYESSIFKEFRSRVLGKAAPIVSASEKPTKIPEKNKDAPTEFMEKNWGP